MLRAFFCALVDRERGFLSANRRGADRPGLTDLLIETPEAVIAKFNVTKCSLAHAFGLPSPRQMVKDNLIINKPEPRMIKGK